MEYFWDFGDFQYEGANPPALTFGKGIHEISLTISTHDHSDTAYFFIHVEGKQTKNQNTKQETRDIIIPPIIEIQTPPIHTLPTENSISLLTASPQEPISQTHQKSTFQTHQKLPPTSSRLFHILASA